MLPPDSLTTVVLEKSATSGPALKIVATPSTLNLTWPIESADFTLQSRINFVVVGWANMTSPAPQMIGGKWQVTLPLPTNTGTTFYRLKT